MDTQLIARVTHGRGYRVAAKLIMSMFQGFLHDLGLRGVEISDLVVFTEEAVDVAPVLEVQEPLLVVTSVEPAIAPNTDFESDLAASLLLQVSILMPQMIKEIEDVEGAMMVNVEAIKVVAHVFPVCWLSHALHVLPELLAN